MLPLLIVLSVALLPQKIHRDTYTRKDSHKHTSVAVESKVNLLMIISDQHRWDALGQAGNQIIQTPNLDSLAREGVRFTNAYSICPVCCPSRTSMLAGRTPEQTQVRGNRGIATAPRAVTYDSVLLTNGWRGEYKGKYHSPYNYTRDEHGTSYYSKPVQWLNGGTKPINPPTGVLSLTDAYRAYLDKHEPLRLLQRGQLMDGMYVRPYFADIADSRYAQAFNDTLLALSNQLIQRGLARKVPKTDQEHVNGRLALRSNHSFGALTVAAGMAALEDLKDGPFTLTVSIEAPHPPFIIPSPFYGVYPNGSIPDPVTVDDPMTASPYHHPHSPSGDEDQVRQQTSNYYGMISQNDKLVGDLLKRLEVLGLSSKTLVVYVADHGEMLGDHHMQSKMVFYEGSVHIPLIMRLPGVIAAGTVVDAPVSNMALFGTILDYLGLPPSSAPNTSKSLRPLIEGADKTPQIVFSFWDSDISPGFMAFDGRFKLMIGRLAKSDSNVCNADVLVPFGGAAAAYYYRHVPCGPGVDEQGFDAPGVDALYDLRYDPREVINLLRSPFVQRPLSHLHPEEKDHIVPLEKARSLKEALVAWLNETGSEYASAVAVRQMNISHINQVPVLTRGGSDASASVMPASILWKVGERNNFTVSEGTFLDVDDDKLVFSGTLDRGALPNWLHVHPHTAVVLGQPPRQGSYLLRIIASDRKSGSAFFEYMIHAE